MQAIWPTAEGELADRLNELPKWHGMHLNTRRIDTDALAERLVAFRDVWLDVQTRSTAVDPAGGDRRPHS